ncbi:MAG: hypothetical protein O2904_00110 [bacterium]|nr:hypothetical protein [bacterium]
MREQLLQPEVIESLAVPDSDNLRLELLCTGGIGNSYAIPALPMRESHLYTSRRMIDSSGEHPRNILWSRSTLRKWSPESNEMDVSSIVHLIEQDRNILGRNLAKMVEIGIDEYLRLYAGKDPQNCLEKDLFRICEMIRLTKDGLLLVFNGDIRLVPISDDA